MHERQQAVDLSGLHVSQALQKMAGPMSGVGPAGAMGAAVFLVPECSVVEPIL